MENILLEGYKKMLLIRVAQQELVKLYLDRKIFSMVHFYIGQEAVAVGVCQALKNKDRVMGNHRSHGHYLAKGGDLRRMICELLGRANGLAHGKGGSMHMVDRSVNFFGSTPILGSVVPIAAGVAFAQRYNGDDGITVAFYGDGASEEGVVYESYNLAALWRIPVLYIIENNLFSINSKLRDRRAPNYDLQKILSGFGVPYMKANGNDFEDVYRKAVDLVDRVRKEKIPAVLECMTYRHMAHSTPLFDEVYREEDVLEKRLQEDPVRRMKNLLLEDGIEEVQLMEIEDVIRKKVLGDIQFALASPYPSKDQLYSDMYA